MNLLEHAVAIDHAIGDKECISKRLERVAGLVSSRVLRLELRVIARLVAALEGCHR